MLGLMMPVAILAIALYLVAGKEADFHIVKLVGVAFAIGAAPLR